jgi:ribulose-5-phosphate 4-epimerase/fuculose-1-phosphate aldolase
LHETHPVVLMRGHGDAVVGPNLQVAVFRAIYTEVNANLQLQATMLGGPITFLNQYEAKKAQGMERTWETWKRQALEREPPRR